MDKKSWIFAGVAVGSLILGMFLGFLIFTRFEVVDSDTSTALATWVGALGSLAAIYFVVQNTNKQIKNQNKQMYRPILALDDDASQALDIPLSFDMVYIEGDSSIEEGEVHALDDKIKKQKYYPKIKFKNIGEGAAINIAFYDCYHKCFSYRAIGKSGDYSLIEEKNFYEIHKDGSKSIEFLINSPVQLSRYPFIADTAQVIIIYSDLFDNRYMGLLEIKYEENSLFNNRYFRHRLHSGESALYIKKIKKIPIKENEVVRKYNQYIRNL